MKDTNNKTGIKGQYYQMITAALIAIFVLPQTSPGQEVGKRYSLTPQDMPPPFATESVANSPVSIDRPPSHAPRVPAGFSINLFAHGLSDARWLYTLPNGDILLAEQDADKVTLLRDEDGDGRADLITTLLDDFDEPFGMALQGDTLYIADTVAVWKLPYDSATTAASSEPSPITSEGALGSGSGHSTRSLVFAPDGETFYVGIGSSGNIAVEGDPRATIKVFDREGGQGQIFASGLRNPIGMDFYPGTNDLYTVVNERDGLGDGLVPDYLTQVQNGDYFGWPYAYIGPNPQPGFAEMQPDLVAKTKVPDLLFLSHSAPIGLVFYDGENFPEAMRGDAFVALRGSWNAAVPRGYMVVRVPFENGEPVGHYEAFVTGFRLDDDIGEDTRAQVWGRPVGLTIAQDGSLLIADDTGNTIWRVHYTGEGE